VLAEEVEFRHGDDRLGGTLYLPGSKGPFPAVAMVLGSGAQDRAYGGAGPFLKRSRADVRLALREGA
jgi:hypothetical protein